jgi:hypothetical protein
MKTSFGSFLYISALVLVGRSMVVAFAPHIPRQRYLHSASTAKCSTNSKLGWNRLRTEIAAEHKPIYLDYRQ